jgi:IS1 family transposase
MANVLNKDKQVAVLSMLLEGSGVRATERVTGVHRDTICRLMVRVGTVAGHYSSCALTNLDCRRIEVDEIWAYVAKKNKNVTPADDWTQVGDQYTFVGWPNLEFCSTSLVERSNLTIRTHCRRLTRLALGFSKKLENLKASMDLYFAYYNFVRTHRTIRCTPAEQAGVIRSALTVADLVDMAA